MRSASRSMLNDPDIGNESKLSTLRIKKEKKKNNKHGKSLIARDDKIDRENIV